MKVKNLDLIKMSCISIIGLATVACNNPEQKQTREYAPPPKNQERKLLQVTEEKSPPIEKRDDNYCPACGMG